MKILPALLFLFPFFGAVSGPIDTLDAAIASREISISTVDWLNDVIDPLKKTDPEALQYYALLARDLARDLNYKRGEATALSLVGIAFWQRDAHEQSMEYYFQALTLFQEEGDKLGEGQVLTNIGNTYDEIGRTQEAKRYVQRAIAIFQEIDDFKRLSWARLNLGVIHFYEEKYDSSLFYFSRVLDYRRARGDTSGMALLHLNIANVVEMQENMAEAVSNYRNALALIKKDELIISNIYLGLGNALLKTGDDQGLAYIDSGLQVALATDQFEMQRQAWGFYRDYYLARSEYAKAYDYLLKEYEQDREIRGKQVQEEIEIINLKYEDEKKARELAQLEAQKDRQNLIYTIIIISILFVLVVAGLTILLQRIRIQNAALKERELEDQLESKTKELTSYALNFIQKNELLNELTEKVSELRPEADEATRKGLNQLNNLIGSSLRIDQDWENFKQMFEELHEGFFYKLKQHFPDLGNAELKLCALLRLNMNMKESSRVLGISSDSVKTARSRLRKKLGLNTEDNLVDFLISFDHANA